MQRSVIISKPGVFSRIPRATGSGVKRELEMYYSAVGILAFCVLFIENMDVMLNRNGAFEKPSWRVYRSLVGAVFMYYITDILWGFLYNRKLAYLEFEKRLNSQILEYPEIEFAVVIFDVNNLKDINDSLGHQAGDQYLKEAAEVIGSTFQTSPVFRIGGDEFAVVARGAEYARIDDLIDKIRMHNMSTTRYGGVVIACGMARFRKDANVAQVFRRADKTMYEDKAALKTYLSNKSSSSESALS